ncbi:hypothetical protein AGLY_009105 [Aphis glycines]|uniref:Uncharacterized protein n=1 Tax=Aphis glycines TaxID=307491 RepID=A0A6G0TJM4_APHGL|nr:hypothetical protein AGLY_009105 [Aphis glycines]
MDRQVWWTAWAPTKRLPLPTPSSDYEKCVQTMMKQKLKKNIESSSTSSTRCLKIFRRVKLFNVLSPDKVISGSRLRHIYKKNLSKNDVVLKFNFLECVVPTSQVSHKHLVLYYAQPKSYIKSLIPPSPISLSTPFTIAIHNTNYGRNQPTDMMMKFATNCKVGYLASKTYRNKPNVSVVIKAILQLPILYLKLEYRAADPFSFGTKHLL